MNGDFGSVHFDIIVSMPLRLQFAVCKRKLDLSRVEYLVLDESDKLFELGFVKQIDSIVKSWSPPAMVFLQSKERAKKLYKELALEDIRVDVIHAYMSQPQRDEAVDNFRSGKTWILIATDVIARGMDFKGVNCVINYDLPESAEAYIHRISCCGRTGRVEDAITLYTEADVKFLWNIANAMVASGCKVPSWIMALPQAQEEETPTE